MFASLGSLAVLLQSSLQIICPREAASSHPQENTKHHLEHSLPASCDMARVKPSFCFLPFLLAVAAAFLFRFIVASAEPGIPEEQKRARLSGNGSWCIAKPSTDETKLVANMEYSCKQKGVDCRDIGHRGACFIPNNAVSQASVAMNLYHKAAGMHDWNCFFKGTGLVIHDDPSIGNCQYA